MTLGADNSSIRIAEQWAQIPPEHLAVALAALDPQLAREHERSMKQLELRAAEVRRGQDFGLVIALVMLVAAVAVAWHGMEWLAAVFCGPGLLALAKLFVLRTSDTADMHAMAGAVNTLPPTAATRVAAEAAPEVAGGRTGT